MDSLKLEIAQLISGANQDPPTPDSLARELGRLYANVPRTKDVTVRVNRTGGVEIDRPTGSLKVLRVQDGRWVLADAVNAENPGLISAILVDP